MLKSKMSRWLVGAAVALLTALLDWKAGIEISFSIVYLLPVVFLTWAGGRKEGDLMVLLTTIFRGSVDYLRMDLYSSPAVPLANTAIRVVFFVVVVWGTIRVKELLENERRHSTVDFLTGLYNNRSFFDFVEKGKAQCLRNNMPLTIVFIDCDDFKNVNDNLGHKEGDEVLKIISEAMRTVLRSADIIARIGGDEFALALPGTGEQAAKDILLRLQVNLCKRMEERSLPVTFSIGAATITNPSQSVDALTHLADTLMYEAKREGKNKFKQGTF
ncbi:MAG: GGDEF domain-containing protein [Nitrospirae bacterium]|nr:GGDEF domain-containing protein [Nitrospirota bacterium]